MLGQQFYHETMRKVVVAFGTIFNNINIVRKNNTFFVYKTFKGWQGRDSVTLILMKLPHFDRMAL